MNAQRKPNLSGIESNITALRKKLDEALAVKSDAEEAIERATGLEVTQALLLECEGALAKAETALEAETAKRDKATADLTAEIAAHGKTKAALATAQSAATTATKALTTCEAELAAEETDCEKAETGETAALVKVAGLEATVKQQAEELRVLRSKPATVTVTAPVQQAKKSGKQTVRATVRERDPNGRASVVDVVVQ